jgi:tRNA/rRNA methyltransferase
MIHIILMEPEHPGNIGAVARVMKNFGFRRLILVKPKTQITEETRRRAKHAQDILKNALVVDARFLRTMDVLIGTTSKLGTDYNIYRSPVTVREMPFFSTRKKVGILIGREGIGLTNAEMKRCDFVVTIPASRKYPTLNISHSVAILLYELFQQSRALKSNSHINRASRRDRDILLNYINRVLDHMHFSTTHKRETQRIVWQRIIGKSMLTKRESFALMGFFRKLE